jgi:hypothetical protein
MCVSNSVYEEGSILLEFAKTFQRKGRCENLPDYVNQYTPRNKLATLTSYFSTKGNPNPKKKMMYVTHGSPFDVPSE